MCVADRGVGRLSETDWSITSDARDWPVERPPTCLTGKVAMPASRSFWGDDAAWTPRFKGRDREPGKQPTPRPRGFLVLTPWTRAVRGLPHLISFPYALLMVRQGSVWLLPLTERAHRNDSVCEVEPLRPAVAEP